MLNIKFEGQVWPIKNQVEEFTIEEFEKVCSILNEESKSKVIRWAEVLIYLGVPEEVVDEFDSFSFIDIIKEYNIFNYDNKDIIKEFEIDGYTYISFDEEFKLTVKEMGLIEQFASDQKKDYLGELMAIIYKRKDLTKAEHFDKAHIKFKAKLFRESLTADKVIPLIAFLSKKLVDDVNLINSEYGN